MSKKGDEGVAAEIITTAVTTVRKVRIVLALDIGSSSIRCSPYECSSTSPSQSTTTSAVRAIPECCAVRKVSSVRPNTGKIILTHLKSQSDKPGNHSVNVTSLFDEIDDCIDESLHSLRSHYNGNNKNEKNSCFQIVGVGISTFVMNFIGVNSNGQIINDEESTLSYACNSPEVVQECHSLKQEMGDQKLMDLYQRTGAPLHNAYALGQLRVYYNKNNSKLKKDKTDASASTTSIVQKQDVDIVHQWTTIASYCIQRWTGNRGKWKNTISFSEASWTGLFNFHTCQWDDMCCDLLPTECRESLPYVADLKDEHYFIEKYITQLNGNGTRTGRRTRNLYWDRWPELRGGSSDSDDGDNNDTVENHCRLFLGIGDGICANIGSKCSTPERIACTIGTSAAARVCLPYKIVVSNHEGCDDKNGEDGIKESILNHDFVVPFGLFSYRIDKNHILVGGALTDGGSIVEFLRKLFN